MHELAIAQRAAMRDQVDLRKAGGGHVPAVGAQRNVMLEQRAGLRAAIHPLEQLAAIGRQAPVDLAGRDA
jgi:hypothetical protein